MNIRKTLSQKDEETLATRLSAHAVKWIGSLGSLAFHTVVFCLAFSLYFLGIPLNTILLTVTTIVSLEAIYLAIFVQMTLNTHSKQLMVIKKDEDVELEEEKNVDIAMLKRIEHSLKELGAEVSEMKRDEQK